jgi:hypothetical protein
MEKKKKEGAAALFIPAGFFLGFGLGFLFNNIPAGMFLGIGAGFLLFVTVILMKK